MKRVRATSLNYRPSKFRMTVIPALSVMICSAVTAMLPIIAKSPILPPFGLMMFVSWRLLRRDAFPIWAGAPLGFFDDLLSGQPVGSSVFLWSVVMIALEAIEHRFMWRDYWMEWFLAGLTIGLCLIIGLLLANLHGGPTPVEVILPQILVSILCYPLMAKLCSMLDNLRIGR